MAKEGKRGIYLSKKELEILELVADGKTDAEIGIIINLSPKTINYHIENMKRKFEVRTRIQAVVAALRRKYIY